MRFCSPCVLTQDRFRALNLAIRGTRETEFILDGFQISYANSVDSQHLSILYLQKFTKNGI